MKDSPAVIVASGLAGLVGGFFPLAQGWVLEQSVVLMGVEISAENLGLFAVSRLLFLPSLVMLVLGAVAMKWSRYASRGVALVSLVAALCSLGAWYFQKMTIESLSVAGVGPALGLFLLLVSGVGGLLGSILLLGFPQNSPPRQPS
jgi:hypothetical protein